MRAIDKDGLLLCDLQAKTFELSIDKTELGSAVFVRRFMNSRAAKWMDNGGILASNIRPTDLLDLVEEEYGHSEYGSKKLTHDEMFWIGYVYRYFVYTYEKSSASIYRELKPKELRDLFLPYHTMDPAQAIERILEARGQQPDQGNDIKRQYQIFRKIRNGSG